MNDHNFLQWIWIFVEHQKVELLNQIATANIVHTFCELGAFNVSRQTFTIDSLIEQFRILPDYKTLISRWLMQLSAEGFLEQVEGAFINPAPFQDDGSQVFLHRAEMQLSDMPFVRDFVGRCGQMSSSILTGKLSPLETLFPGGSLETAEGLYEQWALSRYFNGIIRRVIGTLVEGTGRGQQLRVIEVGAGTGGTTASLLPVLPSRGTKYFYTDLSKFFFSYAERKFSGYPFLHFGFLNIEKDPVDQGFGQHAFDVVVAANVLHATMNLDDTVRNVTTLLKPGGLLLLYELTCPPAWMESSFGLIEGWHRFDDGLRRGSPLLSRQTWETVLRSNGFEEVTAFPEAGSPAEILGAHVLLARVPTKSESLKWQTPSVTFPELSKPEKNTDSLSRDETQEIPYREILDTLRKVAPSERLDHLVEYVRLRVMRVLRRDDSDPIDRRHHLMDLGIDSLMAVELRNLLNSELGLKRRLPATLIFDYPSVEAIANYLSSLIFTQEEGAVETLMNTPRETGIIREAEMTIKDLSEEEVEKLLLKKLETLQ
ncbi:MAG: methyltransferase [Terriglobia bacterium]